MTTGLRRGADGRLRVGKGKCHELTQSKVDVPDPSLTQPQLAGRTTAAVFHRGIDYTHELCL